MVYRISVRAIVVQGLSVLILCAFIGLTAGFVLTGMDEYIRVLPGLLIMIPPLLDLRGNINGALVSRLGSALHTGVIKPRLTMTAELKANVVSSLILSFVAAITVGALSYAMGIVTGIETIGAVRMVAIATIAGVISGMVMAVLAVLVAILSHAKGVDPDNVSSPIMTAVGDFMVVISIYLAVLLVGWF
jgi:mgtE-like transporter